MNVKFYLGEAFRLVLKTTPFLWIRLGSYTLLGLGLMLYFGVVGGLAWVLGQLWGPLGFITFIAGFGGALGLVRWATRYYFYLLKAAHAAVMTEFIVYGRGPQTSQVEYGKQQVKARFRDTSIMFGVDRVLAGVVRTINRTFASVINLLPIPGMASLKVFIRRASTFATTYIDEAILTRAYKEREPNVWKVAQDGVILYAQCWKPILANAVALTLLSYVEFFLFLMMLGLPALALGALLPSLKVALGIGVLVGAWMLKLALADAYAMAATLLAYHRSTEGMTPNPEWQAKLENASDKFRELQKKASEHFTSASDSDNTPSEKESPVLAESIASPQTK